MIGRTISHYKIVDKLGEGGMGAVYKAEDTTLNRLVALKVLSSHLAENDEARERFVREAQAASSLNHSNITTVHELLEDEGEQFIVMEYVDGKTIRDMVESSRVSIRKAVDILIQAAEALGSAHKKGILHRDVKSSNIMVSMEGNVKVMDFGLAHLEERSQLTRTGTTMGTLAYSSPEQITGRPYDERSEIWSLGVVLYELLTGRLPFQSPSEGELVFSIINNEQDPVSEIRTDVPLSLSNVINRIFQKDPQLRYADMGELVSDLTTVRQELGTTTVVTSSAVIGSKRKLPLIVMATSVILLGAVMAFVVLRKSPDRLDPDTLIVFLSNPSESEAIDQSIIMAADELIQAISQVGGIKVVPFGDIYMFYRMSVNPGSEGGSVTPLDMLTDQYRAGLAITGTVYERPQNNIEFRINLKDQNKGENIHSILPPIRGSIDSFDTVLEELRERTLSMLANYVDPLFGDYGIRDRHTPTLEARAVYQVGIEAFTAKDTSSDWGADHFIRANQLDPEWIIPLMWATRAYWGQSGTASSLNHDTVRFGILADSLSQSLRPFRKQLPELARLRLDWLLEPDFSEQFKIDGQALELVPPGTMWDYERARDGMFSMHYEEAVDRLLNMGKDSYFAQNNASYFWVLIHALHNLGRYEEEIEVGRMARKLFPEVGGWIGYESYAWAAQGKLDSLLWSIETGTYGRDLDLYNELKAHGHVEKGETLLNDHIIPRFERLDEDSGDYRSTLAFCYILADRLDEAERLTRELSTENPDRIDFQGELGIIAAKRGDIQTAHQAIEWLQEQDHPALAAYSNFYMGCIAAQIDELDRAVDYLTQAWQKGWFWTMNWHAIDFFEPLRDHPGFQRLISPKK